MDLAELKIREAGYHAFSFRDLAQEIGITSASVHHHFATKADMVIAIMRRHTDRFAELVAPVLGETADDVIAAYRLAIRDSLCTKGGMCLGGVLGVESAGLPPELVTEVEQFFCEAVGDLAERIGGPDAEQRAFSVFATLEGGLVLARAYSDISAFDRATACLVNQIWSTPQPSAPSN